ncbi:MAG: UDP-N-acetylglucosamine 2-epimerase, partial [Candidatus Diapherotrites archaeon]|nr:UDP-N-acetylglucosamine 2-epimerase [Candidatus Diapherotrites archaeon]
VFSLDLFLLRQSINPVNALRPLLNRKKLHAKYARAFSLYRQSSGFKENMVFKGMQIGDLFEFKMQQLLQLNFPEFVHLIESIEKLFEKNKPSGLLLWTDFIPFEKICALIAIKHKVPSIVVQHGMFPPPLYKGGFIRGFVPMTADKMAVWSNMFKKTLVENGIAAGRVAVTGNPKFDSIYESKFNEREFRRQLGIPAEKRIIVCATQPPVSISTPYQMVKLVLRALKKFPECFLVVKPHPVERAGKYLELVKRERNAIVLQKTNLYELLNAASAVIMHNSTVGYEAMLLGKPVILYATKPEILREYNLTDAVLKTKNQGQLEEAVSCALEGGKKLGELREKMRLFSHEINFRGDGKATERIIELIKKTI